MNRYDLLLRLIDLYPCPPYKNRTIKYNASLECSFGSASKYYHYEIIIVCKPHYEYYTISYDKMHQHIRSWINRLCLFVNVFRSEITVRYE